MKNFKCFLITPLGSLFDGDAVSVSAPGQEGRFQVLAGHEHFISSLQRGYVKITASVGDHFFAMDSGVLEVDEDRAVVILADKALPAENEMAARSLLINFDQTSGE